MNTIDIRDFHLCDTETHEEFTYRILTTMSSLGPAFPYDMVRKHVLRESLSRDLRLANDTSEIKQVIEKLIQLTLYK